MAEPVAVLMIALLHFIPDSAKPHEIITEIMDAVSAGSMLAITHITYEDIESELVERIKQMSSGSHVPLVMRSTQEITDLFGALPLAEGKLVDAVRWGVPEEEKTVNRGRIRALFGYSEKK
ncbi:SAM-dependent methyltransferase [Streptosporangium subroseum]|uniref:SAM-dependent methyltransferase n=1 Tax=Streptosporangium subroseum TaxID=106412 RepID=UPI003F4E4332